ncbi:hypothetical protein B0O99DRAFT_391474 [Bisporella sp. PMI_857]|nr:hypothetical protein B0O99DRAFT_391474 [Bisporella sp. PMI_857]
MSLKLKGNAGKPSVVRYKTSETWFLTKFPLNKRAWVLQEIVLSNRVVHFTGNQLFWQCRSFEVSKDYTYGTASREECPV